MRSDLPLHVRRWLARASADPPKTAAWLIAGAAFFVLFRAPAGTLVKDWWSDPEASHGLLLGPLALYLAWRRGPVRDGSPSPRLGLVLLLGAVALRYVSELAAEPYTMRLSLFGAAGAIAVALRGPRQLRHWWLSAALLVLSVPLPQMVIGRLALPLQLYASTIGAQLLEARDIPVELSGNIIRLPGQSLFVSEACSGLRSLTALLSIGVLMAGLFLKSGWARALVLLATIPVAVLVNGVRVFATGFLVVFVSPMFGSGFLHYTEGWALFLVSLSIVGTATWLMTLVEARGTRAAVRPLGPSEVVA